MPTSPQFLKEGTSKVPNRTWKRVIIATSLVVSNVASYVVGNDTISATEIVNLIVTSLVKGLLGS